MNKEKAFTLLEVLLVIGIIIVLAGISMPVYQSFKDRNDLGVAVQSVAQSLRQAQVFSRASNGDSSWGVYLEVGKITLFKGATYAGRDIDFDEETDIVESISISGTNEIIFSKLSGLPQLTGVITLISSNNVTSTIVVNSKGMVEY